MASWGDVAAKIKSEAQAEAPRPTAGAESDGDAKIKKRVVLTVAPGLDQDMAKVARTCVEQPFKVKDKLRAMQGINKVYFKNEGDGVVLTLTSKGEAPWAAAKVVLEELFVVKAWAYIVRHVQTC